MSSAIARLDEAKPAPVARLANWTPWPYEHSSLIGHADVTFSGGWRINRVPLFRRKDGSWSVGSPSSPLLDRSGQQRCDLAGKKLYAEMLQFETAAARERWQGAVLGALAAAGITPAGGAAA